MKLTEIFQLGISMGIEADPRGKDTITKLLKRTKEEYEELSEEKKKLFDQESLSNPYSDSRILFGNTDREIKKIMVGIDIEPGEILLADRLNQKGEQIDLIIGHHPEGISLIGLSDVMDLQTDLLASYGIAIGVVEGLMNERIEEIKRRLAPGNHQRAVDTTRLLDMPFMNLHTPTDNLAYRYLEDKIAETKPELVKDVLKMINDIPEYREAAKIKAGPVLFSGSERNRAGKVVAASFTGGTEGSVKIYEQLAAAGVSTIIGMHASEEHVKKAKEYHLNLVIAGHISSDSLGMNLFLDELEKQGIAILSCSGLIRINRFIKA